MTSPSSAPRAPLLLALTLLVAVFMIGPVLLSVSAGLMQNYSTGWRSGFTLRWLGEVWENYGSTVLASILIATAAVVGNVLIGVPCAYALARSRRRWTAWFEELMTLPVAVPGLATALALTLLVAVFMIGPVLLSVSAGLMQNYSTGWRSGFTLRWLGEVWENYGSTVLASILIATAAVVGNILIGVPCAYALARSRRRWTAWFEELMTLPVAVPGLATALALILAYGQLRSFRQSFLFVLVGHMVFTLPFMVRTVAAAFRRHELIALEEAASTLGASFAQRFMGVLVPAVFPAIVSGALMVFTLSIGEFNLTWMLHTPLTRTLPVGLADSYASMRIEIGSAYTLVFLVVVLPLLWLLQLAASITEKRYGT